jgi:flagellar protein FliJ
MAGNVFELEQVLLYRREMEKLRKQEFAVAKHQLEMANEELQREEALVALLSREYQKCQQDMGCIDDMKLYLDFFTRKRVEIQQYGEQIEQLDQIMDEKRSDLMEASKDKKVLESLKKKQAVEFRQLVAVRERNFLDEISIQKKGKTA